MRGDVHRLPRARGAVGHEQSGQRYAVVLQSDDLPLSTTIVAPTSTRARETHFRPQVRVKGRSTRILVEQMTAVDLSRVGERVGRLTPEELSRVATAVRRVLALDLPW